MPNCTVLPGFLFLFGTPASSPSLPFLPDTCYSFFVRASKIPKGAKLMEWTTPHHEEIDLNCEVSSYANAEL